MPSLNGDYSVWGQTTDVSTRANPKARLIREYPGVDGLASLDCGARGGRTTVAGFLWGADESGLAAAEAVIRDYQLDGGAYTFTDDYEVAWYNVIVAEFEPVGPVRPAVAGVYFGNPVWGGFARKYRAVLLHLS